MIDKPVKVWITSIKIIQSGLARLTLRSTVEAQAVDYVCRTDGIVPFLHRTPIRL